VTTRRTTTTRRAIRRETTDIEFKITNDFEDVPDDFRVELPLIYRDRIGAVCLDQQHCTIANAIVERGNMVGITFLGGRGVSKKMVSLYLDPKIFPWADPNQEYRARLTTASAEVAKDLDDYATRPKAHERAKRQLEKLATASPNGLDTVWETIIIVAPYESQKKFYKRGKSGPRSGSGSIKARGLVRRYNGAAPIATKKVATARKTAATRKRAS
jgi:hypothetical protein